MGEDYVTAREVAEHFRMATKTVRKLAAAGALPSHRLAGQIRPLRFKISECEARFAATGAQADTDRPQLREVK